MFVCTMSKGQKKVVFMQFTQSQDPTDVDHRLLKPRDRAPGVHMQEGLEEQHVYPVWIEV